MNFSYQWLREFVPGLTTEPAELQRLITMKTAECEGIRRVPSRENSPPDWIIEIDNKSLTHRPDLWGHYGMAREVAAITGLVLTDPVHLEVLPRSEPVVKVQIEEHTLCPRYSALRFDNVTVGPSPHWLQMRLESLGLNPINNIVDVTNYILTELPQPMHAFDAAKLMGDTIFVRLARTGEQLHALNGETYNLDPADLVIADAARPVGLAGVIGGFDSAISETTTSIILESANFLGSSVRFTATRHKLRTDASMRFEKSLDPENTLRGLARAVELFEQVCPGIRVAGGLTDNVGHLPQTNPVLLPVPFVGRKLGKEISEGTICQILIALGFTAKETAPGLLTVTVPSWRATKDISIKDDLVDEVGRIVGYEEIAPAAPLVSAVVPHSDPMRLYLRQIRAHLAAQGFTEVYNYSFVNQTEAARFIHDGDHHVGIQNPIASELTHLRRSLLSGVFRNILGNVRHYAEFRVFEIGSEIHPSSDNALPSEVRHAVAALYNAHGDEQDFFELKRVAECVFPSCLIAAVEARAYEHPVRASEIRWHNSVIGRIFELHPSLLHQEGIEGRALAFDVDLEVAQKVASGREIKYRPLRKYPTSGFDLSIVADLKLPVQQIQEELSKLASPHLAAIDFVRQYAGPPLPEGRKSVSYHLEIGAIDHTMTADEVTEIRNRIIQGMRERGFELRI